MKTKQNKTDNACQVPDISIYTNTLNLKSSALNHQGNNTMYKGRCIITTEYGSGVRLLECESLLCLILVTWCWQNTYFYVPVSLFVK